MNKVHILAIYLAFRFAVHPSWPNFSCLENFCVFRLQSAPFYLVTKERENLAVGSYAISLKNLKSLIVLLHALQFGLDCVKDLIAN